MKKRTRRRILITLASLTALAAILIWTLTSTSLGARLVVGQLEKRVAGLSVGPVSGSLRGPLRLREIAVETGQASVTIEHLIVDWRLWGLFSRRLTVDSLRARGVNVILSDAPGEEAPGAPEDQGPTPPLDMPIELVVTMADADEISIAAPGSVRVHGGRLSLSGTLDAYRLRGRANLSSPQLEAPLAWTAAGGREALDLDVRSENLLHGRLQARARLAWTSGFSWDVSVEAEDLRPGSLFPDPDDWPGRIALRARSDGRLTRSGAEARVSVDTVTGDLRERTLDGWLRAGLDGDRYSLTGLSLAWGSIHAEASGTAGDSLDVELDVSAPDLAIVAPGASGSLQLAGRIGGPRSRPSIVARSSVASFRLGGYAIAALEGDVDLDLRDLSHATLDLTARRIDIGGPVIERVEFEARGSRVAETGRIHIERATVGLGRGTINASGWFGLRPVPSWDVTLEAIDLDPSRVLAAAAPWPGRLTLRGGTDGRLGDTGPEVDVSIDRLGGTLRGEPVTGRLAAAIDGKGLSLSTLRARWGAAELDAAGRIGEAFDLNFAFAIPDLGTLIPDAAGALRGSGELRGTRSLPRLRGSVDGRAVQLGGYGADELVGRANLGYPGVSPAIELEAKRVSAFGQTVDSLTATGYGIRSSERLTGIALDRLSLWLLEGHALAQGELLWHDEPSWRLHLEGVDLAPAALFPDPSRWPGRISFLASLAGEHIVNGPSLHARLDTLYGSLRNQPLSARAALDIDSVGYSIPHLDLGWGSTVVQATGDLSEPYDFSFEGRTPDLGTAIPEARGSVEVAGRLTGTAAVPILQATLDVRDLDVRTYRAARLTGNADLDLRPAGQIDLSLRGERIELGERGIRELVLDATGDRAAHRLSTYIDAGDPILAFEADGTLNGDAWRGTIRRVDLRSELGGAWQLDSAVPLAVSAEEVRLGSLCLTSEASSLCSRGAWHREEGWELNSTLRHVPLAPLGAMLPPRWTVHGSLSGTVDASVAGDGSLFAAIALDPGPGAIRYPLGNDTHTVRFRTDAFRLDADARGIRSNLDLTLTEEDGPAFGSLIAKLELPGFSNLGQPLPTQPVVGQLRARLETLDALAAMLTRLSRTDGRLEASLSIDGTVANPRMVGDLRLADGQAELPELGLRIEDVQITAAGDRAGTIRFDGRVRSGPGQITVAGESPVIPSAENPARIRIEGSNFQVSNTPAAQVLASPTLETRVTGERISVEGDILIPRASIEFGQIPKSAVPVSDDVIFVDAEAEQRRQRLIAARVRVILGDDVRFRGFGLSTGLEGSIRLTEEPGRPTAGSGELLMVRGNYKAYGRSLDIERGRLLFGGGRIDNPGLDVRASRVASDSVVAGLIITGTLRAPTVTLFSEPPLPESEALSYLVLGRPITETSTSELNTLTAAARSLGLRGGNLLARKIAARFGLAEARIEGGRSLQQATFVAGKYLSPRLYVIYGIGLFDHASTFRVRYMLSSRWTLMGETGEWTSTDLLYRIETGR